MTSATRDAVALTARADAWKAGASLSAASAFSGASFSRPRLIPNATGKSPTNGSAYLARRSAPKLNVIISKSCTFEHRLQRRVASHGREECDKSHIACRTSSSAARRGVDQQKLVILA